MWASIWKWAKDHPLIAIVVAGMLVIVLSGAIDGTFARSAASRYLKLAKGWAEAYKRDTEASKREYEAKIRVLTDSRDSYKKKYEVARGKMNEPWIPPSDAKKMQERFNKLGYRGTLK